MAIDFEELANGGMSADQLANVFLREYYSGKEISYPINPFQMLTDLKIAFLLRPFKKYEGIYIPAEDEEDYPIVGINLLRPIVRQRFTAAHELCHHLKDVHSGFMCATNAKSEIEKYAENFASELLMPTAELRKQAQKYAKGGYVDLDGVLLIADYFGVSFISCLYKIAYRLHMIQGDTDAETLKKLAGKYKPVVKRKEQGKYDTVTGKTWNIPEDAEKPERSNKKKTPPITLLDVLRAQKASKYSGGIYHKTQIDLTYNSNHIEGSRLTHDQTRYIFETNTIGMENEVLNVDDVIETANHFRCIDKIIDNARAALTENFIKELHLILKTGTSDSRKEWFAVGDYKKVPNEVGGMNTPLPEEVSDKMKILLKEYNSKEDKTFEDILDFHVKFERIHPFQDGNGRVGRLIMFKECLKYNIVPFIIEDDIKLFYYRGLKEWDNEKGYLRDTCLTAQDKYKAYLDYFRIEY